MQALRPNATCRARAAQACSHVNLFLYLALRLRLIRRLRAPRTKRPRESTAARSRSMQHVARGSNHVDVFRATATTLGARLSNHSPWAMADQEITQPSQRLLNLAK
jgi:hypothetical protein